jgi:hypothetical protein
VASTPVYRTLLTHFSSHIPLCFEVVGSTLLCVCVCVCVYPPTHNLLFTPLSHISPPLAAISVCVSCPKVGVTLVTPCPVTSEPTPHTSKAKAPAAATAAAAMQPGFSGTPLCPGPDVKLSYISLAISGVSFLLPNVHQIKMHVRVPVCVCASVCVCLSVCACVCACVCMCVCVFVCVC